MNIVAKKIKHNIFGIGRVAKLSNNMIFVRFDDGQVKSFLFPESILTDLFFVNPIDNNEFSIEYRKELKNITYSQKNQENNHCLNCVPVNYNESNDINIFKLKRLIKKQYTDNNSVERFPCLYEFCNEYKRAINHEILYLKRTGGKHYQLRNGSIVSKMGLKYVYAFETDTELNFQSDITIVIYKNDNTHIKGKVIACDENIIVFVSDELDSESLEYTEISSQSWTLLETLNDALDDLKFTNNKIVKLLIEEPEFDDDLKTGQNVAVEYACKNPLAFIWGPPGTGKTTTLAKVVMNFLNEHKRVLMLSQSNVSVDGAVLKLYEKMTEYIDNNVGEVVRYGYPKDEDLIEDNNLTTFQIAIKNNAQLKLEEDRLIAKRKNLHKRSAAYKDVQQRLNEIHSELKQYEAELVLKARFVATTISKAIMDKNIKSQKFDAVIIDEVSMVYTPQVVFAANLSKSHFCCFGDFCQLPAIVENMEDGSVLKNDIFSYYGIPFKTFSNLVMLDTQYRMHPEIADFVSSNMYFGLLKSGMSSLERQKIASAQPYSGKAMSLFDSSELNSICLKTNDGSHYNLLSALLCAKIVAETISGEFSIGVITPYSAQAKLINSIIKNTISNDNLLKYISCNTVHQFQGSERDIIIYDPVDTFVQQFPGALITSGKSNEANRLFNVAITRSKGKFITIADCSYLKTRLSKGLLYSKLLEHLTRMNDMYHIEDNTWLKYKNKSKLKTFTDKNASIEQYINDFKESKDIIRLDLPNDLCYPKSLDKEFYQIVETYGNKNPLERTMIIRVNNKKALDEKLLPYVIWCKNVYNPITIIDKHIIWYGVPFERTLSEKYLCWRIDSNIVASQLYNLFDF